MTWTENHNWGLLIVAAVLITVLLAGLIVYENTTLGKAALSKGLCQGTVAGTNQTMWTTCPEAPHAH